MTAPPIASAIAAAIRHLRAEQGLSQERLAVLAGVDRVYASRIERALTSPSVEIIDRIAAALGLPLDVFFAEVERQRGR